MASPEVDNFGRLLVHSLSDSSLDFFDGLAKRHGKSPSTHPLQPEHARLNDKQRALVRRFVVACVDRGMHDCPFALGEAHDSACGIAVVVDRKDIASLSDSLHSEPFGENGLVAKFGKRPESWE